MSGKSIEEQGRLFFKLQMQRLATISICTFKIVATDNNVLV